MPVVGFSKTKDLGCRKFTKHKDKRRGFEKMIKDEKTKNAEK